MRSVPTPHKWTMDALKEKAGLCSTRGEFKARFPGGYNRAIRFGVLDAVCSHMESPYQVWTEAALETEASKYATRSEFRKGSPNAYAAAIRQRRMPQLARFFRSAKTGIGKHMVYRLSFASCIYIGLTCTSEVRNRYHLRRGAVAQHITSTGESLPPMEILADGLTPQEASFLEVEEILKARQAGLPILNKASGGQLGAFGRFAWTRTRVIEEAVKYQSRSEFRAAAPGAFSNARLNGWLDEACQHMVVLRHTYSDSDIGRIAKRFSSRSAFQRYEPSVYNAARSRGVLDAVCGHMRCTDAGDTRL